MDVVNKPPHYQGEVEAIDSIKSSMSYEAFKGYCQGNALKYIIRFDRKNGCLLYTSPSPRDRQKSRMPSSA